MGHNVNVITRQVGLTISDGPLLSYFHYLADDGDDVRRDLSSDHITD